MSAFKWFLLNSTLRMYFFFFFFYCLYFLYCCAIFHCMSFNVRYHKKTGEINAIVCHETPSFLFMLFWQYLLLSLICNGNATSVLRAAAFKSDQNKNIMATTFAIFVYSSITTNWEGTERSVPQLLSLLLLHDQWLQLPSWRSWGLWTHWKDCKWEIRYHTNDQQ